MERRREFQSQPVSAWAHMTGSDDRVMTTAEPHQLGTETVPFGEVTTSMRDRKDLQPRLPARARRRIPSGVPPIAISARD